MPHPTSTIGRYLHNSSKKRVEYIFFDPNGEMRALSHHSRVTHVVAQGQPVVCAVLFENEHGKLITDQLVPVEELVGCCWEGAARGDFLTQAENRLLSAQRVVKLNLLIAE